jgi:hypothetical protein
VASWDAENADKKFFALIYSTIKRLAIALPTLFPDPRLRRLSANVSTTDIDQTLELNEIQLVCRIPKHHRIEIRFSDVR